MMPVTAPATGANGSVVLYANGLGDAVINRPALAALAARLPRPVRLIHDQGRGGFLWNGMAFDEILELPMTRLADGGRHFEVEDVPAEYDGCAVFATMVPWFSRSLDELVARLRPGRSYGLLRGFDVNLPLDYDKNSVELGFDIARAALPGCTIDAYRVPLAFDAECERKVASLFDRMAVSGGRRILAVHTETLPGKQWDPDHFREVLCRVLAKRPDAMAVFVDYRPGVQPCECHGSRILRMPGLLLQNAMRIVGQSDVFLGIDSCMLHAADLAGVPGVALFGPDTRPEEFGYYWTNADHLRFAGHGDRAPVEAAAAAVLQRLNECSLVAGKRATG